MLVPFELLLIQGFLCHMTSLKVNNCKDLPPTSQLYVHSKKRILLFVQVDYY